MEYTGISIEPGKIPHEWNIDTILIKETKKHLRVQEFGKYVMNYSGGNKNIRAGAGVAILFCERWRQTIGLYKWISEYIVQIRCCTEKSI